MGRARGPVAWPWPATDAVQRTISRNAVALVDRVAEQGARSAGEPLSWELAREWHRALLHRVPLSHPAVAGGFRGSAEPARLRTCQIAFGQGPAGRPEPTADSTCHVRAEQVAEALAGLQDRLRVDDATVTGVDEVLDLCTWVAVAWADIHPFVDLNGATGRLWITFLAARHGVPLQVAAKPRPDRVFELPSGEELAYVRGIRRGTEEQDLTHLRRWLGFENAFQRRDPGGVRFVDQRPTTDAP